jgi:hypothetical protein
MLDSAANIGGIPVADNPTPPARLNLTNVLRSIIFAFGFFNCRQAHRLPQFYSSQIDAVALRLRPPLSTGIRAANPTSTP